ncbi:sulfite exporter TauE/SafE family protein [Chrysiogenes arsenatis]|uniref:sulfite exporter TauE/SafE family protein n=1 Tax=Chrysiogenes arsenatis TaxID=309797 RepID=UPI0003F68FB8|nr:sulfite exporter TauE/SafE family protein [Chrysiogenes arsenatis]
MTIDPGYLAIFLGVGLTTGFLAALLGIGGGVIYVPVIIYLLPIADGMAGTGTAEYMKTGITTSLVVVFFAAISSSFANLRARNVHFPLLRRALVAGTVGALAGAFFGALAPALLLKKLFGAFQLYIGTRLLQSAKRQDHAAGNEDLAWKKVLPIGTFNGFITSTFGIGGGLFSVPAFNYYCRVPLVKCIGTSSNLILVNALFGIMGYLFSILITAESYIRWDIAAVIAVGSMLSAPLGIKVLPKIQPTLFKRGFALLVLVSAANLLLR